MAVEKSELADAYKEYCRANQAVQSAIGRQNLALRARRAAAGEFDTEKLRTFPLGRLRLMSCWPSGSAGIGFS